MSFYYGNDGLYSNFSILSYPMQYFNNSAVLMENPETTVDTGSLIKGILGADKGKDGLVSRQEIAARVNTISTKLNYLNMIKLFVPFMAQQIDAAAQKFRSTLDSLTLVNDNYDVFSGAGNSTAGEENQINISSLLDIVNYAQTDGNLYDFSVKDLAGLAGKANKT